MNPDKATRRLTMEIIEHFNLPYQQTYEYIRDRMKWSMGIGYDMGRRSHNPGKMVVQKFSNGKVRNIFPSMQDATAETGVHWKNISAVCRGKRKTAGGYQWEFLDPQDFYRNHII